MFRTRLARALLIPAALMIPASAAMVAATASPAGAAVPAKKADAATCTTLTGTVNISTESATGTFTGCTSGPTGGPGKFKGSESSSSGKVTWANKGVTKMSFGFTLEGQETCPAANDEIVVTGTVSKSTGGAAKIKAGQQINGGSAANTADFCWNTVTNALTLAPSTSFEI
jgi:hypothetical protein